MLSNIALVVGLIIPVAFVEFQQPQDRPKTKEMPPGQVKQPSSSMLEDPMFRDTLAAQEKRVWEAMKAGDWSGVENLCSDRFVMVGPEGIKNKSEAIEIGKKGKLSSYTLSDWKSIKLDPNSGLITYKAVCTSTPAEGGTDSMTAYHSTLWRRDGGNWIADMHQVTPAQSPTR